MYILLDILHDTVRRCGLRYPEYGDTTSWNGLIDKAGCIESQPWNVYWLLLGMEGISIRTPCNDEFFAKVYFIDKAEIEHIRNEQCKKQYLLYVTQW